ncbi:MAG: CT583 family protein [Verrucomicrobia bacterium]|nr:CT583 family protein [Verrucomicrobiota bacterium]MBS0646265.1 CT583 family protein [Verrucomicrobiota bacterium]
MSKLASLLHDRFLKKKETPKMAELAKQTTEGQLTVFSGLFQISKLADHERSEIESILKKYAEEGQALDQDLPDLLAITQEVKAITNQAVILHGERIRRAQLILKRYRDGAFTAWLIATYGNRQTPYNFLQYYDFYLQMPKHLHPQIETMPRQAVYTLASRTGAHDLKEEIVRNYKGETKEQLIRMIRDHFPLADHDKRREDLGEGALKTLQKLTATLKEAQLSDEQKKQLLKQLQFLKGLLK